jgi:hypothetical protein
MVERANGHIHPLGLAVIGKEERCSAACRKGAKPARVPNLSQFAGKKFNAISPDFTPGNEGCRARAATINAMTVAKLARRIVQPVADAAAEATSFDLQFHLRCSLVVEGLDAPGV